MIKLFKILNYLFFLVKIVRDMMEDYCLLHMIIYLKDFFLNNILIINLFKINKERICLKN